ncbi:MAG: FecR domain-containing protein [Draconibacterium sp.]|nr:FecR domain-containing protein [Draconibacterium sp.]
MEQKGKLEFESLIKDEQFVQEVLHSENPDKFINELIKNNSEKEEVILTAVEFLIYNQSNRKFIPNKESEQLLNSIIDKIHSQSSGKNKKVSLKLFFRIAAVAIILISIGFFGYNNYQKNELEKYAHLAEVTGGVSKIILSDGSQHILADNNSEIDYRNGGEKIIISNSNGKKILDNSIFDKSKLNQVIVPYGKRQELLLSDSTLVTLNSGSKLVFPAVFKGSSRRVFLIGEAFFKVKKRKDKKPFLVETENIDIKVLGTKFNVSAYDSEEEVSTVLIEGSVEVSQKNKLLNNAEYTLTPGQGCFYNTKKAVSVVSEVETDNYIAWLNGYLQFQDQTVNSIICKLRRHYNKSIIIENEQLSNDLISGKLILSEDFESVLINLSTLLKTRVSKDKKGVLIIK